MLGSIDLFASGRRAGNIREPTVPTCVPRPDNFVEQAPDPIGLHRQVRVAHHTIQLIELPGIIIVGHFLLPLTVFRTS